MTDFEPPVPPPAPPGWGAPPPPAYPAPPPPAAYPAPPPPFGAPPAPPYGVPQPPATPWYGQPMGPGNPYGGPVAPSKVRSVSGLSIAVAVLLGLLAAFDLIAIAVELATAGTFAATERPAVGEALDAQDAHYAVVGLHVLGIGVVGLLWVLWQRGHSTNAKALGRTGGLGAGMAVGGWVIPIAGLVLGPLELAQSARPANEGRTPALLSFWALVLVLASALMSAALLLTPEESPPQTAGDRDGMHLAATIGAAGFGVSAIAALAAIVVVVQATRRQEAALRTRGVA